eukprot:6193618-Alexandrium_andersonii.AAC.1
MCIRDSRNAKLYRRTCGAPCTESVFISALDLQLIRGCAESPQQRGVLCAKHQHQVDPLTALA